MSNFETDQSTRHITGGPDVRDDENICKDGGSVGQFDHTSPARRGRLAIGGFVK